ncbi:MAG: class I SAM-dependent methyltransferase [Chthoniobacteraceae bacterium]
MKVGVQDEGTSPDYIKRMAISAWRNVEGERADMTVGDIGGGRGELTRLLAPQCKKVVFVDFSPPPVAIGDNVEVLCADLNERWPVSDSSIDFLFSLECIEHVENPRHFLRESARCVKPGGHGFISTPNQHSVLSKMAFLFLGQHRCFLGNNYPHHITALLRRDFRHLLAENGLDFISWYFSNEDNLPGLGWRIPFPGNAFSKCMGVMFYKPFTG